MYVVTTCYKCSNSKTILENETLVNDYLLVMVTYKMSNAFP